MFDTIWYILSLKLNLHFAKKKKKKWIHSYKRVVILSYTRHLLLSLPHTCTQQLVIKL